MRFPFSLLRFCLEKQRIDSLIIIRRKFIIFKCAIAFESANIDLQWIQFQLFLHLKSIGKWIESFDAFLIDVDGL